MKCKKEMDRLNFAIAARTFVNIIEKEETDFVVHLTYTKWEAVEAYEEWTRLLEDMLECGEGELRYTEKDLEYFSDIVELSKERCREEEYFNTCWLHALFQKVIKQARTEIADMLELLGYTDGDDLSDIIRR